MERQPVQQHHRSYADDVDGATSLRIDGVCSVEDQRRRTSPQGVLDIRWCAGNSRRGAREASHGRQPRVDRGWFKDLVSPRRQREHQTRVQRNGKSLERAGSDTREVVLCGVARLMEAGSAHRRYMEPRFLIISPYPTSWAYSRNIHSHRHNLTTELVGSTKEPTWGLPNTSPEKQTS